jgi:hypothetical protein
LAYFEAACGDIANSSSLLLWQFSWLIWKTQN